MRSILLRIRGIAVFNRTRPKGELSEEWYYHQTILEYVQLSF